jgi:hypothetical protein
MTQLRVFQDLSDRLWVEVTSPTAKLTRSLFVRAYWQDVTAAIPVNPNEVVIAEFQGKKLLISFLLVSSRRRETWAKFKCLGSLDDNPSRDVLNNILDILAY